MEMGRGEEREKIKARDIARLRCRRGSRPVASYAGRRNSTGTNDEMVEKTVPRDGGIHRRDGDCLPVLRRCDLCV